MNQFMATTLAVMIVSQGSAAFAQRGLNLNTTGQDRMLPLPPAPAPVTRGPGFTPAPIPNRDASAPPPPRASNDAQLAPSLFSRRDQYRGEGFSPGSTAQGEQDKRTRPGAGFNLRMPLEK